MLSIFLKYSHRESHIASLKMSPWSARHKLGQASSILQLVSEEHRQQKSWSNRERFGDLKIQSSFVSSLKKCMFKKHV